MKPAEFWSLTPFEFGLRVEGYVEETAIRRQELLYLAWHIEAFHRQKRLPPLKNLFKERRRTKRASSPLTTEQLMNMAKRKGLQVPTKWR
jgi:hypothetical protein